MLSKAGFQTPKVKDPLLLLKQPNCRCFHFSSHVRKQGVFKSPNYPYSYPAQIDCILYLFQALSDEIVQINFWSFNLPPPRFGVCYDYAAILAQPPAINKTRRLDEINFSKEISGDIGVSKAAASHSSSLHILCGGINSLQRTIYFSRESQLGIVFHSSQQQHTLLRPSSKTGVGFHGKYLFINATNFRTEGVKINGSACSYVIHSSAQNLFSKKGKFFSPGYPSDYPENIQCTYTFVGQPDERVVLSFRLFHLSHPKRRHAEETPSSSCPYENQATERFDRVLIHEVAPETRINTRTIARICGSLHSFQIVSNEAVLQMTFLSFQHLPKNHGFAGEYAFVKKSNVRPSPWTLNMPADFEQQAMMGSYMEYMNILRDNSSKTADITETAQTKHINQENRKNKSDSQNILNSDSAALLQPCRQQDPNLHFTTVLSSTKSTEGTITSPYFPSPYPKCTNATIFFHGQPHERVYLQFLLLELGDHTRCNMRFSAGDRIQFFDGPTTKSPPQMSICGSQHSVFGNQKSKSEIYPLSIVSSGSHFTMQFTADDFSGKFEFGYRAVYKFEAMRPWMFKDDQQAIRQDLFAATQPITVTRMVEKKYFSIKTNSVSNTSCSHIIVSWAIISLCIGKVILLLLTLR
nr:unnamed protein product [Spirometra erinaceieuropaei]